MRTVSAVGAFFGVMFWMIAGAQAANWGAPKREDCVAVGKRRWSMQLLNISGDWNAACQGMAADVGGQHFASPTHCVNNLGEFGQFDVNDSTCPHWTEPFRKDDCTSTGGRRQFSSQLVDLPAGADWQKICQSTPADVQGVHFAAPSRCTFSFGQWGAFDVPDSSCGRHFGIGCRVAPDAAQPGSGGSRWGLAALATLAVLLGRRRTRGR